MPWQISGEAWQPFKDGFGEGLSGTFTCDCDLGTIEYSVSLYAGFDSDGASLRLEEAETHEELKERIRAQAEAEVNAPGRQSLLMRRLPPRQAPPTVAQPTAEGSTFVDITS